MANRIRRSRLGALSLCLVGMMLLFSADYRTVAATPQQAPAESHGVSRENFAGRNLIVFVPSKLPASSSRALVVVLHGGLGNADRIENEQSESALKMDTVAEKYGFVVAYLSGTPAGRLLSSDKEAWNSGGECCGFPAKSGVNDLGYIKKAVDHLAAKYGIDRSRIFGMGHSNGSMMTQRVVCEAGLYSAAVTISGPLSLETQSCSAARGIRILAIHGQDDENVPLDGGYGTKGVSGARFHSEAYAQQVFTNSGANYTLQIVKGADHQLSHINDVILRTESQSIPEKAAAFFGLSQQNR